MARLPYLDRSDLAPADQDLLARNINLFRALTHSPNGARSFSALANFIRFESKLDPRLRELAILQVGYLTRSPYEFSHHVKIGRDFGVSDDDIRAIAAETEGRDSGLDSLAKLVLKAAREMTAGLAASDGRSRRCAKNSVPKESPTWCSSSPSTTPSCACWRRSISTSRTNTGPTLSNFRCRRRRPDQPRHGLMQPGAYSLI